MTPCICDGTNEYSKSTDLLGYGFSKWGRFPFLPMFLHYPSTEIDADYTVATTSPFIWPRSATLRFWKMFYVWICRCKPWTTSQSMSNFGTFWAVPNVGVVFPKTRLQCEQDVAGSVLSALKRTVRQIGFMESSDVIEARGRSQRHTIEWCLYCWIHITYQRTQNNTRQK